MPRTMLFYSDPEGAEVSVDERGACCTCSAAGVKVFCVETGCLTLTLCQECIDGAFADAEEEFKCN